MNRETSGDVRRHADGDPRGEDGLPRQAALLEYHQLILKWKALSDSNQAAYCKSAKLPMRQVVEQLRREYHLMESAFHDATEFIGRMLGIGNQ